MKNLLDIGCCCPAELVAWSGGSSALLVGIILAVSWQVFRQELDGSASVLDTVVMNHFNGMACAIPGWLSDQLEKWRVIFVFILFFRVCEVSNWLQARSVSVVSPILKLDLVM